MAYEGSESAWNNFGKFMYQFQPETKRVIRKLERILDKVYRRNLSLLSNETCIIVYIYIYIIYIYIYIYIVFFGPVKPELGIIPSGQENYSWMNI